MNILQKTEDTCTSSLTEIKKFHGLSEDLKSQTDKQFTELLKNSNKNISEIKQLFINKNKNVIVDLKADELSYADVTKKIMKSPKITVLPTQTNVVPIRTDHIKNAKVVSTLNNAKTVVSNSNVGKSQGAIPKSKLHLSQNDSISSAEVINVSPTQNSKNSHIDNNDYLLSNPIVIEDFGVDNAVDNASVRMPRKKAKIRTSKNNVVV